MPREEFDALATEFYDVQQDFVESRSGRIDEVGELERRIYELEREISEAARTREAASANSKPSEQEEPEEEEPEPAKSPKPEKYPGADKWSGRERNAYITAYDVCSAYPPKNLARQLDAEGTDPDSIAWAFAYTGSYQPWAEQPAYEGCFDAVLAQ